MRFLSLGLLLLSLTLRGHSQPGIEPLKHRGTELNGQNLTAPEGFVVELAVGPPLINRPIVADFDDEGRLYVADAAGTNEPVKVQLEKKPHRIVRLEDTDGDGKFDKNVVFADKMMFPEGVMWLDGSLYVSAPPSIWKLTDTDGDGVADQRVEWFNGKTLTGCANDLHGPYRGPDGWIYWCKGAFAEQTYERNSKPWTTRASHIFRARPDGSGIEPVMTGGMDNPVDVVFTPGGERIFTTTFLVHPGGGKRDGLIHAIYGGINGKDHQVIHDDAHRWTGPELMPVLSHLGAAVPAGLARYESDAFGPGYRDNLFAALFNLHKVSRHVLSPNGATFTSKDEDFLISDSLDFHPTDVIEDADGSLLVVDTGGWYKLCCPTSQLHKPDLLGAIYRVRRKDAKPVDDPRGKKIKWASLSEQQLADLLDDARPVVRRRAVTELAQRGKPAMTSLSEVLKGKSAEAKRNAVWVATRISSEDASSLIRRGLRDADETVRQVALHSISLRRERTPAEELRKLLKSDSAHNRRGAAEALGRIGAREAVPDLFEALTQIKGTDRVLEHSLIYALIEIGDEDQLYKGLQHKTPAVRRAALIALDQCQESKLDAQMVMKELSAADARLREAAWWIAGRHPGWGENLAGLFRENTDPSRMSPAQREEFLGRLVQFLGAKAVQKMIALRLRDPEASAEEHAFVLRAVARANLKETPSEWLAELPRLLSHGDPAVVREAIAAARTARISTTQGKTIAQALLGVAGRDKAAAELRVAALEAIPGGMTEVAPAHFELLLAELNPERPVGTRSLAANVLSKARLSNSQLLALTALFKTVGPLEIDRILEAFAKSTDEKVGLALTAALKDAASRESLRPDLLRLYVGKYPPSVVKEVDALIDLIDQNAAKQRVRLEQLLAGMKDGDIRRGQKVFHSQKTSCVACHAIGYLGGKVGPDLTHIGRTRSERDLLEAIVFPSASLVRSYEPVQIATKDGKSHNGLLKQETADEVLLVTGANQEVRINRKQIEEIEPSKVSVMPSGLDQQLTTQDLADLVAFLRACK